MDWTNLQADVDLLVPEHYTPGRGGQRIRYVVIHHNAGRLSAQDIYNAWLVREASAHYQVDVNGRISQHVNDSDTAWHAGNQLANQRSIGIEHANSSGATGPLSAATLDAGAHLTAAVCVRYGLGRPEWCVNVYPHNHFYPTACPGPLAGAQRDPYMRAAQRYYDQTTGVAPAIATQEDAMPTPIDGKKDYELRNMIVAERAANATESLSAMTVRVKAMDAKLDKLAAAVAALTKASA